MITRPRVRPQSLLQAVTRPTCLSSQLAPGSFSRSLHVVPPLVNGKDAVFKKYGVPGFLSPAAFEETWTQYQDTLCKGLNDETTGTTLENKPVKDLHIDASRQPSKAVVYNLAAQAHHNHFFFNALSAVPEPYAPNDTISAAIREWFESPEHLRDEITDAAMSMFGNGYVWLMSEDRDGFSGSALEARVGGPLRILCTYNAGSPFAKAHRRQQAVDRNTGISRVGARLTGGHFGDNSPNPMEHQPLAFVGEPLLCLKVWEHQWMRDYGLAGKERYIRNWWDRIDWDEVHARLNVAHNPRERIASPPMDESRASLHQYATNLPS